MCNMADEAHWHLCWRARRARGRGAAIVVALNEEYTTCFNRAVVKLGRRAATLELLRPLCVRLVYLTAMPLWFDEWVERVCFFHKLERVVCAIFAEHLLSTWCVYGAYSPASQIAKRLGLGTHVAFVNF